MILSCCLNSYVRRGRGGSTLAEFCRARLAFNANFIMLHSSVAVIELDYAFYLAQNSKLCICQDTRALEMEIEMEEKTRLVCASCLDCNWNKLFRRAQI